MHLQGLYRRGNLGGYRNVVEINKAPAGHLRAIAQVEILGERVGMPPPCILEACPPPDARGAVEVEESATCVPPTLLEEEVSVEEKRLRFREPGLVAIQVVPAGLHHAHRRVTEGRQKVAQEVRGCDEVGVEHQQVLALRHRRRFGKRPGLEAVSMVASDVHHIEAACPPVRDAFFHDPARRVVGVVEHLHLE